VLLFALALGGAVGMDDGGAAGSLVFYRGREMGAEEEGQGKKAIDLMEWRRGEASFRAD